MLYRFLSSWNFPKCTLPPCAEMGEVDVSNSFSVNNTCFIALNSVYANSLVITCWSKGQISNGLGLQVYNQVSRDVSCKHLCSVPIRTLLHGVHPSCSYVCSLVFCLSHGGSLCAHSALGCSRVHRREKKREVGELLVWGQKAVFFFPIPSLFLCLSVLCSSW